MLASGFESFSICFLSLAVPVLVIVVVWRFFRSAVRSGVQQGSPPPAAVAPPAPPVSEEWVRGIVRDELRKVIAERQSRKA